MLSAALMMTPVPAAAVALAGTKVRFFEGSCASLVVGNRRGPGRCRGQLVNLLYPSGNISFVFADGTGRLISFKGRVGLKAGSQTTLKVEQITLVPRGGGRAFVSPALGSCVLTPFAADRSRLECAAKARTGLYSALFQTSSATPKDVIL